MKHRHKSDFYLYCYRINFLHYSSVSTFIQWYLLLVSVLLFVISRLLPFPHWRFFITQRSFYSPQLNWKIFKPLQYNKYPSAKPGILHRRVKPWDTSAHVMSRWYGLPAAKDCYLLPVNGLLKSFPSSAVRPPGLLPIDAECILQSFYYSSLLYPHSTSTPELPIAMLEFQLSKFLVQHQLLFSLQIPHKARNQIFRWYLNQHMDMVGAYLSFYDFYLLPISQCS